LRIPTAHAPQLPRVQGNLSIETFDLDDLVHVSRDSRAKKKVPAMVS